MALLTVKDLSVGFGSVQPLDGISFAVDRGQILGIVGESGSGKSLTALAVLGLLPLIGGRMLSGSVVYDGRELTALAPEAYRQLRGRRIGFITQNPMTSLDPMQRVGDQIAQGARLHLGLSARQARARAISLMERLRIPDATHIHDHYPHQLSGGMKQRIVIAMALAAEPELIIADEPTTALDVTIQAQIIGLLAELVKENGLALVLITHDMGVVAQCCDKVCVLYAGRLAETDQTAAIFAAPRHPYTADLMRCIARPGMAPGELRGIPGAVPSVANYPSGCRYHPRCATVGPACRETLPPTVQNVSGGAVACHFPQGGRDD